MDYDQTTADSAPLGSCYSFDVGWTWCIYGNARCYGTAGHRCCLDHLGVKLNGKLLIAPQRYWQMTTHVFDCSFSGSSYAPTVSTFTIALCHLSLERFLDYQWEQHEILNDDTYSFWSKWKKLRTDHSRAWVVWLACDHHASLVAFSWRSWISWGSPDTIYECHQCAFHHPE